MTDTSYEKRELRYLKFKRNNPDTTFAQYVTERLLRNLNHDGATGNPGAIGVAIGDPSRFWSAGEATAEKLFQKMALRPHHKVIEYGCGSLRVGAHFIRYLDGSHFLGMDVISGFFEMGKAMIGAELLSEKAPHLHVIGEAALAMAEEFSAECIYSNLVCVHVHPDETGTYFRNLARVTRHAGSRLFFNAELADRPTRYDFNCWAWPAEFYVESLRELELVQTTVKPSRNKSGHEIKPVEFEFRR